MARKKRSGRRRGMGSVIQVRQLSGTERLNNPSSVTGAIVPVLLGAGVTFLTAMGIRMYVEPTADNATIRDNADYIGLGAGGLTGLALWNMASRPAGVAAIAASAGVALAALVPGWMAKAAPTAGLRAIVPEYTMRGTRAGVGSLRAIAMQSQSSRGYGADAGGENLSLRGAGLSAINAGAFGTPGFKLGRR